jgi:enamine deaminase RidA (YjgF/YER057c/UK114 family)
MSRLLECAFAMLLIAATPPAWAAEPPTTGMEGCRHRNAAIEQSIGYCQAVRVGDVLYVSGITAAGPMEEAIPKLYERLRSVLADNGLAMQHVAKENLYATDLDAMIRHLELRKPFYEGHLPAATWVQVERLYLPELVLEVEVIAHYPR